MASLHTQIKRIYDHLYANASVRTPSAIATEVGKLIRVGTFIEQRGGELPPIPPVAPAFTFSPKARRELLRGHPAAVAGFAAEVRRNYDEMNEAWGLYEGEEVLLSDADLAWSCAQLDGHELSSGTSDVFGDAVEIFRTSWAKQSSGQFFTDARVARLAMVLLQFDPVGGDDLVDICCGTGGFLLAGLDYIEKTVDDERSAADLACRVLRGQEVDPEICDVANASLVTRVGRSGRGLVVRGDSIEPGAFSTRDDPLHEDSHRCAASNPPFGTKITVKDRATLQSYDLARGTGRRVRPRAPDILLLERNVRMLVPGEGRLAIVLPYQILSGPQTRYIREWLLRQAHLVAVVDLPTETFQPHTGTKTALLVVRRRASPLDRIDPAEVGRVFMSTPRWIGHDRRGKPVVGPTGEVLSDIEDVGAAFETFLSGGDPEAVHSRSFPVRLADVARDPDLRLNARYHRDGHVMDAVFRDAPGWNAVRLGDIVDNVFHPARFKRRFVDPDTPGAVPFFGGSNILQLVAETKKFLASDHPRLDDLLVKQGWVLVTRSGSAGIVSTVPRAWDGVAMSEHIIRVVPKPGGVPAVWIATYLRSSLGQRALSRGVFGSVIDEITPEHIADLEIPLPEDPTVLEEVVDTVLTAESARQSAIDGLGQALDRMEALLPSL